MEPSLSQEPVPQPISAAPVPIPQAYRDRSTGLTVFGVLEIAMGGLCALMIPFMLLGAAFARRMPGGAMPAGSYVSAICTYAFVALGLVTLGIGSIRARRWARALNLILSWAGLIVGVVVTIALAVFLPASFTAGFRQAAQQTSNPTPMSTGVAAVVLTVMIVFFSIFFVLVPLAFLLFFRMKDVEETCKRRDPVERWTDRCPLPVLAATLLLGCGAVFTMLTSITTPVFPFFGTYLGGVPGAAALIAVATLDIVLAVWLYQLRPLSWWIAVIAMIGRMLSAALTYRRTDILQMYSKMGWSQNQVQLMTNNPMIHSRYLYWWTAVVGVIFLGYMLWIKRYFVAPTATASPGPSTAPPEPAYQSHSNGAT